MEEREDHSRRGSVQADDGEQSDRLDRAALDRLGGIDTPEGRELIGELIQLFRDGGNEALEALRENTAQNAWQNLSMTAHNLKSSAGYLGATRLSELAAQLEQQCTARTKDVQALTATVDAVMTSHARVLIALAALADQLAER